MFEQEIIEGNNIIAEFDGKEYRPIKAGYSSHNYNSIDITFKNIEETLKYCNKRNKGKDPNECFFPLPDTHGFEWKYHISWDWLMPIVEKIESIIKYEIHIYSNWDKTGLFNGCKITNGDDLFIRVFEKDSKINVTYQACIEFIKWYNLNK